MKHLLSFPGFHVQTSDDWRDVTDSLDAPNKPFTLAKPDGVGAMQFSPALYRGGRRPAPSKEDLLSLALDMGQRLGLGDALETNTFQNSLVGAAASYHSAGGFVRIWYLSDGENIMFATYACDWDCREEEISECEEIIKSLKFVAF
jgi:hypothetical protein